MLQVFIIIVIQVQTICYKAQWTDRRNEIGFVKILYATKSLDGLVNKFCRQFSLRFKAMINAADLLQLFRRGKIDPCGAGAKATRINSKDQTPCCCERTWFRLR